jgi:predicted DNA-binding transcriptional regulator AlpA
MQYASPLRVAEAAEYVGLSPSTLNKLRCVGGGPPFLKFGRSVRYLPEDCRAWRDARRVRHTSEAERLPKWLTDAS